MKWHKYENSPDQLESVQTDRMYASISKNGDNGWHWSIFGDCTTKEFAQSVVEGIAGHLQEGLIPLTEIKVGQKFLSGDTIFQRVDLHPSVNTNYYKRPQVFAVNTETYKVEWFGAEELHGKTLVQTLTQEGETSL